MVLFGNTFVLIFGDFRELFFSTSWSTQVTGEGGITIEEVTAVFKGVLGDFLDNSDVEGEEEDFLQ